MRTTLARHRKLLVKLTWRLKYGRQKNGRTPPGRAEHDLELNYESNLARSRACLFNSGFRGLFSCGLRRGGRPPPEARFAGGPGLVETATGAEHWRLLEAALVVALFRFLGEEA